MLTVTFGGRGANEYFIEGEQRNESKGEASLHWQKQLFQILLPVGAFHHSTKRFLSLQIHFFISYIRSGSFNRYREPNVLVWILSGYQG